MLKTPEEEKNWLAQFQQDLIQDRIDETGNASPLYYAIRDYKDVVTAEGYQDSYQFYHADTCATYDTMEDIFQETDIDTLKAWEEQYEDSIQVILDENDEQANVLDEENPQIIPTEYSSKVKILDKDNCIRMLEEEGYIIVYLQTVPEIKADTLFFTRAEANHHLECNRHHYTKDAHSYAMTAWRSPQYEHVLELLHNIDWENSQIAFRIPKNWHNNEYYHALIEAYFTQQNMDLSQVNLCLTTSMKEGISQNYGRVHPIDKQLYYHPNIVNTIRETIKRFDPSHKPCKLNNLYPCLVPKDILQAMQNGPTQDMDINYIIPLLYRYENPTHHLTLQIKSASGAMESKIELWHKDICIAKWEGTTIPRLLHLTVLDTCPSYIHPRDFDIYFYAE